MENIITVQAEISAPLEIVWEYWTLPEHIINWNAASDDWHTPHAVNDLREGGKFLSRMEARDGSFGFDFEGTYETVVKHALIVYKIADGRKVKISFSAEGNGTRIVESFKAENVHTPEQQQEGWQAILNNFKNYTEGNL